MKMKSRIYLTAQLLLLVTATAYAQTKSEKITLSGQLVCSDCWAEADRKTTPYGTPADLSCARDCAEKGIPSAIAVKQGNDYKLYLIEQDQLKQNRDEWLDRIGGQVEINGRPYAKKGQQYISVESYQFLSPPTTQQQAGTVGSAPKRIPRSHRGAEFLGHVVHRLQAGNARPRRHPKRIRRLRRAGCRRFRRSVFRPREGGPVHQAIQNQLSGLVGSDDRGHGTLRRRPRPARNGRHRTRR
jgi:hypothetical protein